MVLEELDEQRQREWEQSLQDALVIDWQREAEMQGWDTDAAIAEFQRRTEAVRADSGGRIRRIIEKAVRTMESGNKPRYWRMTLAGRG